MRRPPITLVWKENHTELERESQVWTKGGDVKILANFFKAIPDLFTTIEVNTPIKSEILRITEQENSTHC